MQYFRLTLLAYAALVVETSVVDRLIAGSAWLIAGSARLSLLPLVVVAAALTIDGPPAIVFAAGVGLLGDCLSPGRLGVEMFCAIVTALAVQLAAMLQFRRKRTSARGDAASAIVLTGLSFSAVFAMTFSSVVIRYVFAGQPVEFAEVIPTVAYIATGSALVCLGAVLAWRSVKRLLPQS